LVAHNTISGNYAPWYGGGIYCTNASPTIYGNVISGDSSSNYGGGIYLANNSNADIRYNVFSENWSMAGGAIYSSGSYPVIVNNTFCRNYGFFASALFLPSSTETLRNNIFSYNSGSDGALYVSNIIISHCDFYGNTPGNFAATPPAGTGVLTTTNANGDSCDVYFNIFMDPMFVDTASGDYHLLSTSPCIDAGDPSSPLDPDSTITDIGCYYFDQSVPGIPSPVTDLTISCDSLNAHLIWSLVTTDTSGNPITVSRYVIYASENAFFIPVAGDSIGFVTPPDTSFTDTDVLSEDKRFYNVKAKAGD
jgi:predicted outer membrane repeat protein